jgi:hypothetical protein
MLDLEFLASAKSLKKSVIFGYRTGLLKGAVRKRISELCDKRDRPLTSVLEFKNVYTSLIRPSLFGGSTVLHELSVVPAQDELDQVLQLMVEEKAENSLVLMAPEESTPPIFSFVKKAKFWEGFAKGATVIEEVEVTKLNVEKIIPLILPHVTVYDFTKLKNRPEFDQAMVTFVEGDMDLWTFFSHIEVVALTLIDSRADMFDLRGYKAQFKGKEQKRYYELQKLLLNILKTPLSQSNKTALLLHTIAHTPEQGSVKEGEERRKFVGSLYRALKDLMIVSTDLNPMKVYPDGEKEWSKFKSMNMEKYAGAPTVAIFHFLTLLMANEPIFLRVRPVVALSILLDRFKG